MAEPLDLDRVRSQHGLYDRLDAGREADARDALARELAGDVPGLLAEVERLCAELAQAKHRLGQVTALAEAADPQHHVPADGTLIVASYGTREQAFRRSDVAAVEAGEWWEVGGADLPTPYGVILGHDEPPQDRRRVDLEAFVPLDDLRCALDGVL